MAILDGNCRTIWFNTRPQITAGVSIITTVDQRWWTSPATDRQEVSECHKHG